MDTGAPETAGIIGCPADGTARRMKERTGAIPTMTVTKTVGTITRGIGIVRITEIVMNTAIVIVIATVIATTTGIDDSFS